MSNLLEKRLKTDTEKEKNSENGGERAGVSTNQTTENTRKARNCGRTVRPPCGAGVKGTSERSNVGVKRGMDSRSVATSVRPWRQRRSRARARDAERESSTCNLLSGERKQGTTVLGMLTSRELKNSKPKNGRAEGCKQGKCKDRARCELEPPTTLRDTRSSRLTRCGDELPSATRGHGAL